jgi:RimJ/RimL family protein N-acetyltransferase
VRAPPGLAGLVRRNYNFHNIPAAPSGSTLRAGKGAILLERPALLCRRARTALYLLVYEPSLEGRTTIHAEEIREIEGRSVVLRPPRPSDVELVYEWDRDPELAAWNGRPPLSVSLEAARRDYLTRWREPGVRTFIIEAEGEPIGMATLYDFRNGGCDLGIKIGPKSMRGKGYASEAVELLVEYAFEELGLQVVRGSTLAHNHRMQRVFEKCGFREVGDGALISRFDNRRYTELFYERRDG